ncbi:MAG: hypothetical protein AAGJ52_12245 [Pseudomonadota bacterium]
MIARFTHRPAHSLGRRLLDAFRSRFVGGLGKSQRVFFVQINGQRYKRVVFGDSAQADRVATAVQSCQAVTPLPRLYHQHENELWFEFVEGQRLDADAHQDALAHLFAALHGLNHREVPLDQTTMHQQLSNDLEFLKQVAVLDDRQTVELQQRADALRPDRVLLGADYLDPVLKNFVFKDGRAVIIDLESIDLDALLGTGVAKCGLHWLPQDQRSDFVERIIELGAPDFRAQRDYAELALITGWTKRKLLAGKRGRIRVEHFDRFLR